MNYENFVTNYHRYTRAHRTLSEAFKTPEYCSAITKYPSRLLGTLESVSELFVWIGLILGFAYCFHLVLSALNIG